MGTERLTPHAHECLVRFGSWAPFGKAAEELAFSLRVQVSEPTARRYAQAAGAAYEQWQTEEVERLERETPEAPKGAEKLFLSVDGAFVPIVGGEWVEVKTLTIGEIVDPVLERGEWVVHSQKHSYFSRLEEAQKFRRLALVETHQRGVERAETVAAVTDGAEWEQGFIDFHCPQAVRILDFPHAAGYVSAIGQTLWGSENDTTKTWLNDQLHHLKHDGPTGVLEELQGLQTQHPTEDILVKNLAYLDKREPHMHYPDYQAQGLPIASGAMESGNKLVVEARLKGAGMHWAPHNVNSMLALRNILCSGRWEVAWPQVKASLRQAEHDRKQQLRARKLAAQQTAFAPVTISTQELRSSTKKEDLQTDNPKPDNQISQQVSTETKRPAPNHPWRNYPIGQAKYLPSNHFSKN